MNLAIVLVLISAASLSNGEPCKSSGIKCINGYQYQICVNLNGDGVLSGAPLTCPDGQICDDDGFYPCHVGILTTTPAPITAPPCYGDSKHRGPSCSEYFQCVPVWWWWEPRLVSCPVGQVFDEQISDCGPIGPKSCGVTTVPPTTTTPIPVTAPPCYGPTKHPATYCDQYYECVQYLWWWEPRLRTCPTDYAFNAALSDCEFTGPDCGRTTTVTTLAPTTPPPIPVPACYGSSKHPATLCNQFYQCVSVWWWWEPRLLTCPPSEAFNKVSLQCEPVKETDCPIAYPIATTTAAPPITAPPCYGYSRHQAPQCNQYFECVSKLWWWEPQLRTCADGLAFNVTSAECESAISLNCLIVIGTTLPEELTTNTPTTTTTEEVTTTTVVDTTPTVTSPPVTAPPCYGSSKHPATLCYQYYECESVWWWWEPHLKTCPSGLAFNPQSALCEPADLLNCLIPTTTTASPPPTIAPETTTEEVTDITTQLPTKIIEEVTTTQAPSTTAVPVTTTVASTTTPATTTEFLTTTVGGETSSVEESTTIRPATSTVIPVTAPPCYAYSKYPASLCNQYYECVSVLWWWEPRLRTCPDNQGFNPVSQNCEAAESLNCHP